MINLEYLLEKGNSAEVEAWVKESLEGMLVEIHSPAAMEGVWADFQAKPVYQNLIKHWPDWNKAHRESRWEAFCRELEKTAYGTRPFCLRCGECCQKGSPTLYAEDLGILRRGIIKRTELITLRSGEIGFSNVSNDLVLLTEERVKVKEKPGSRQCLFFDPEDRGCRIYEDRPLQCRVMECWNPDGYQSLEAQLFLSRKELLSPQDPLIPVIEDHEKRCAVSKLQEALSGIQRGRTEAQEEALDMLLYDRHLRGFMEEKQGIGQESQVLLFGRPLFDLLPSFGFQSHRGLDQCISLSPITNPLNP